jgi:Leucine-rich repeat (LRR) protein
MEETALFKTFWHWSPETNWPPASITHIKDLRSFDRLNLTITQTDLPANQQKKLVNMWCELIPKLTEVKYLWFTSRVSQDIFDAACELKNLQGLFIKWSGIKSIDKITKLTNVRRLHIGSSTQIESIEPLTSLKNLQVLALINLQKIQDYSVLASLIDLRELTITGDVWAPKVLKIETLKPLTALKKLRHLDLDCTRILDGYYEPLIELKEIESLRISRNLTDDVRLRLNKHLIRLQTKL